MRRINWKVWTIIAVTIWLSFISIAFRLNRSHLAKPLPLKVITWKEIGRVEGCADFDGDGNDELVVQDGQGQWWAVWWNEGKCQRRKLPVSSNARFISSQRAIFRDEQKQLQIQFVNGKWQIKDAQKEVDDRLATLGWQRWEEGTHVAFADLDGDRKLDRIEWRMYELVVKTSGGTKWMKKGDLLWAVKDLDGDGKAELVCDEPLGNGNWRIICWHFDMKAKRWNSDSEMPFVWLGGLEGFPCEFYLESVFAIKQGKGFALVGLTLQQQRTKIWKLVWNGNKWQKELFDEIDGEGIPIFVGQDWLALTTLSPPQWWLWVRNKVDDLMQQLNLRGLPKIEPKMKLMRRIDAGKWVTLMGCKESDLEGESIADLDSDGLLEIILALKRFDNLWIFVGKFVSKQWWLGKEKLSNSFASLVEPIGTNFHYHGSEWTLWQDANNHCIAVTVKR